MNATKKGDTPSAAERKLRSALFISKNVINGVNFRRRGMVRLAGKANAEAIIIHDLAASPSEAWAPKSREEIEKDIGMRLEELDYIVVYVATNGPRMIPTPLFPIRYEDVAGLPKEKMLYLSSDDRSTIGMILKEAGQERARTLLCEPGGSEMLSRLVSLWLEQEQIEVLDF
jgi:hypothetical protein